MRAAKGYRSLSSLAFVVFVAVMISAFGLAISTVAMGQQPDLIFMAIDDPYGGNLYKYRYGTDLTSSGPTWPLTYIEETGYGADNAGGGSAIAYINDNDIPDLIFMTIDDAADNTFYYKIGWDIDDSGVATSWSANKSVSAVGSTTAGGGVAVGYINDNWRPDLILMGIDDPSGGNEFRYWIGWDLKANGEPENGWTFEGGIGGIGDAHQGGGATLAYLDRNNKPELVFMAIDDPRGGNRFRYRIGWNLGADGTTKNWSSVIEGPGLGSSNSGGGVAMAYVDNNATPDLVFMGIDNPSGVDSFWYTVGLNVNSAGQATWGNMQSSVGLTHEADGGGAVAVKPLTRLALKKPTIGSDGKVHVVAGTDVSFELIAQTPRSDVYVKKYRWWKESSGTLPGNAAPAVINTSASKTLYFGDPGEYDVYIQSVDSFESVPIKIQVKAWAKPVVNNTPPGDATPDGKSWYSTTTTYVGYGGSPVQLYAGSTDDPTPPLIQTGLTTSSKIGSGAGTSSVTVDKVSLNGQSNWTIAAWIKPTSTGVGQDIYTVDGIFILQLMKNGGLAIDAWNQNKSGDKWHRYRSPDVITFGQWNHLAVTFTNDIDNTDILRVYVNGTERASGTGQQIYLPNAARANIIHGSLTNTIDDVAIFSRFLTTPEVKSLKEKGLAGSGLTRPNDGLIYRNSFDFGKFDNANNELSSVGQYLWSNASGTFLTQQIPGSHVTYIWNPLSLMTQNIKVKAVTNHGIESNDKTFSLKVYPSLIVTTNGPFSGKPNQDVPLTGSITESNYPGATFSYQWKVQADPMSSTWTPLTPSTSPDTTYDWGDMGASNAETVNVQFYVTVTTTEGLILTDDASTTVTLDVGAPMADPGGPYRGGIAGGTFSPIQFEDNSANLVQNDANVGDITAWDWGVHLDARGTLINLAAEVNDYIQLNPLGGWGNFQYTDLPLGDVFIVEGEFWSGGGTGGAGGGDAFFIYLWADTTPADEDAVAGQYSINYDEYQNYATGGEIQLKYNGGALATQIDLKANLEGEDLINDIDLDDSQWRSFKVDFDKGNFRIYLDDVLKLTYDDSANYQSRATGNLFGFGSRTGAAKNEHRVRNMKWIPSYIDLPADDVSNSTVEISEPGTYVASLSVKSEFGKWSPEASAPVHVIDGKIGGNVRAADLRTPVDSVVITLTSSHVDTTALAAIAAEYASIQTTVNGGLTTLTGVDGTYLFPDLPLGSYTLAASRVDGNTVHEFETIRLDTELTLNAPAQLSVNFIDLSVFAVGGKIYYSILRKGDEVYVQDVEVTAQPIGSTSGVESLPSTKSLVNGKNYSLPLFAGRYLFKAKRDGHDVRLIGTRPSKGDAIGSTPTGYDSTTQLTTIEGPRSDISFIDYTTRTVTVFVEDSGGFPIDVTLGTEMFRELFSAHETDLLASAIPTEVEDAILSLSNSAAMSADGENRWRIVDGTDIYMLKKEGDDLVGYQAYIIQARVDGTNGLSEGEVTLSGSQTSFVATVPPGVYTISLPNVPNAVVKNDSSGSQTAQLDVNGGDNNITLVVPVKIELEIGPAPTLLGVSDDFLADMGLDANDNPEGFMFYYKPSRQKHTYIVKATANGNRIGDFLLKVEDNISQEITAPAPTVTYSIPVSGVYEPVGSEAAGDFRGQYTVQAGIPNKTTVDEGNSDTYIEIIFNDVTRRVPKVLSKTITFKASKANYQESELTTLSVTVLGDMTEGSVSGLVSIPNVNYLVLHDPPGDDSYSYLDESMTVKGLIDEVTIKIEDGTEIPVYPSPWSVERKIDGVGWESGTDLAGSGLLGYRDADSAGAAFSGFAVLEAVTGAIVVAMGPFGYGVQMIKVGETITALGGKNSELVQFEVSSNRSLRTPSEDEIDDMPDKMGPGKGDVYYGEGWTLGLQLKYRLGIKEVDGNWVPDTALIYTYDILGRDNQYIYTASDIENIIIKLNDQVLAFGTPAADSNEEKELNKLKDARDTWIGLLEKNPAYVWQRKHIEGKKLFSEEVDKTVYGDEDSGELSDRATLETFLTSHFSGKSSELLVFTGDTEFEYSRTINEINVVEVTSEVYVSSESILSHEFESETGYKLFGTGATIKLRSGSQTAIGTAQILSKTRESGTESEQSVGFVLGDGDTWDSFTTYVYEGPWGTPIFFTDPESVTSWPWQQGTIKGVDVALSPPIGDDGPFDYRDGAHYQFTVTSTGAGVKEGSGFPFMFYDLPTTNPRSATVLFNGSSEDPYPLELFAGFSSGDLFPNAGVEAQDNVSVASANLIVSIYPPENDWGNAGEFKYPVLVQAESLKDYQIAVNKILRPRFADLRAPRATIIAPYDGEPISPALFTTEPFKVEIISDDADVEKIKLGIRSKQRDGVWEPWRDLTGMEWEKGVANTAVTVIPPADEREPQRTAYTFDWTSASIQSLGVGEYQLRAVATDAATQLVETNDSSGGIIQSQSPRPNTDRDAPAITFRIDASPPSVLSTIPFYQDTESDRIYRGELSATFTDDMRVDDFNDQSFEVLDLLNSSQSVAGIVSYSPGLRKAVFVPLIPLKPNGYYRATVKTDTDAGQVDANNEPTIDRGVRDMAGNPLDNSFSWTFRTIDSLFEEVWSITLAAETTVSSKTLRDGNNIAGVETQASDGEDENDASAVPSLNSQIRLSFLHDDLSEYDRDIRPADGRVSHHWFMVVDHGLMSLNPSQVTIKWRPSFALTKEERDYQVIRLVEFAADGTTVSRVVSLDPTAGTIDPETGEVAEMTALTYTPAANEQSRYFRLDVRKTADIVVTNFQKGTSGWLFFSVPINPEVAEPYVNLGDDLNPFKLYDYDTALGGYYVYPLDLDRDFGLKAGRSYFTRMEEDLVEVDVGGTSNLNNVTITLQEAGWHPMGNPFTGNVAVSDLLINGKAFPGDNDEVDVTLYRWLLSRPIIFTTSDNSKGDIVKELDKNKVTTELSDAFTVQGVPLTSPVVTIITAGSEWQLVDTDAQGNISTYIITYDGISQLTIKSAPDGYQSVDANGVILPWEGYWMKTNEDDVKITIPVPMGITASMEQIYLPPMAPPAPVVNNAASDGFTLRLALTSDFAADLITELGTHPEAVVGKDLYDAAEPPTLGQTVAAYFIHPEWADGSGLYNTDYQSPLEVGETRIWEFNVFSDRPRAEMTLSWNTRQLPADTMFFIRRKDRAGQSGAQADDWLDMREVRSISLSEAGRIIEIPFEVRVQRYAMSPPQAVQVIAGEAQVAIRWKATDNPFISGYALTRKTADDERPTVIQLASDIHEYIDTDVIEEADYIYQVTVRFRSGAELHSELLGVIVLPFVEATVLRQNYPNPFNPETWIPYELAEDSKVSIEIYSVHGQLVRALDLGFQIRSRYVSKEKSAYWDGRNEWGEKVASGVYFYLLRTGKYTSTTRKMVILK